MAPPSMARTSIGLRPYLSASTPQIGASSAMVSAAEPDSTPDQTATSARSVTPNACTYMGRKGKPSPKPTSVKNCVVAQIHAVRSQTAMTGIDGHHRRRRAPRRRAGAGRAGVDIHREFIPEEFFFRRRSGGRVRLRLRPANAVLGGGGRNGRL